MKLKLDDLTKEEFIEAHVKVCAKVGGKKRLLPPNKPHKGLGKWRRTSERQRRRDCAKSLWKFCKDRNIPLVLSHSELPPMSEVKS